jgi:uncharacterized membrane protein
MPGFLRLHPRLLIAIAIGIAVFFLATSRHTTLVAALLGWNTGCWGWVLMLGAMMSGKTSARQHEAEGEEDVGAWLVLIFVSVSAVVSVVAIVAEVANHPGGARSFTPLQYTLAASTVVGSWLAVGMAYASHYAHLYYTSGKERLPLRFPGDPENPEYWDFLYFAFTISVAAQTSDVEVMTTDMRRLVTAHSILGFLFNAAIIGFSINLVAGAVGR